MSKRKTKAPSKARPARVTAKGIQAALNLARSIPTFSETRAEVARRAAATAKAIEWAEARDARDRAERLGAALAAIGAGHVVVGDEIGERFRLAGTEIIVCVAGDQGAERVKVFVELAPTHPEPTTGMMLAGILMFCEARTPASQARAGR